MIEADAIQFTAAKKSNLLFPAKQIFRRCCAECGEPLIKKPKSQQFCSLKCSQIRTVQKIADSRRGKHQREGTKECGTCHALVGMSGVMSGRLLATSETTIHFLRKRNSLPTLSGSQAAKSAYIRSDAGAKKIAQQNSDAWWEENWGGVVETYWETRGVVFAYAKAIGRDNLSYAGAAYYWDHEQAKERSRQSAKKQWRSIKDCPIKRKQRSERRKKWASENTGKRAAYNEGWRKRNPEKCKEGRRRFRKTPAGKCRHNARRRIKDLLKAPESFSSLLGCTGKELAAYLEAKFTKKMSWDNYGTYWHIDHVIPLAKFDLTCPKQRAIACHWTNLQPLEAKENIMKSDKIIEPQMSLLLSA